jgi:hypothetical protein
MHEHIAGLAENSLPKARKAKSGRTPHAVGLIAAATFILLAFSGCDNTFSVFQSISQEEKQIGADLFKNTAARAMADDSSNYYVLLGQVVWRPKSGDSWDVLSVNGSTDYFAAGLAGDGTKIYVAKADINNIFDGIYEGTYTSGSSADAWTWSPVGDAKSDIETDVGSDFYVDWIKYVNDTFFVAVHNDSSKYSLFYYNGASFVSAGAAVSGIDAPLVDIVYDGSSSYWLISDSKVYKGTPGALAEDSTASNPDYDHYLLGIASDGAGRVIVSRRDGYVYSYDSGAWTSITVKSSTKLGPLFFLTLPASTPRILVGKGVSSYGYMEYNESTSTLKENGKDFVSTSQSIYYSTITSKQVQAFWQPVHEYDATKITLFILLASGSTDTYALYRNDYTISTESWSGWTAE